MALILQSRLKPHLMVQLGPDASRRAETGSEWGKANVSAAATLADELAERWTPMLRGRDWRERLALLHQIHEQLQEDLGDIELYSEVSPIFISEIIDALTDDTPITSTEQAHIYANSGNPEHRQAAGEWFARQPRREPPQKF
jgi:hypothetical protein